MAKPLTHLSTVLSDRYRIERELGAGSMATAYLAQDHIVLQDVLELAR